MYCITIVGLHWVISESVSERRMISVCQVEEFRMACSVGQVYSFCYARNRQRLLRRWCDMGIDCASCELIDICGRIMEINTFWRFSDWWPLASRSVDIDFGTPTAADPGPTKYYLTQPQWKGAGRLWVWRCYIVEVGSARRDDRMVGGWWLKLKHWPNSRNWRWLEWVKGGQPSWDR